MNHFSNVVDGRTDYYHWVQKDVADAGVNLLPKFALGATLLAMPIVWTSLQWATYSVEQGGEIKGARVFKNQMFIIVGSMVAMGVSLAVLAWAQERAVGTAFFNAVSHSYYYVVSASGDGIGSVLPFPGMFAIVISPNPIITILVALCFILASLQITCNCYIGMTRVMVGMSLDRTLPAWLSKVNPRYPLADERAHHLLPGGVRRDLRVQLLDPVVQPDPRRDVRVRVRLHDQLSGGRAHAVRAKALYDASPGAKYTLGGFPLVTIFGIIGFVFGLAGPDRVPHECRLRPQGHDPVHRRRRHLHDLPGRLLDRPRPTTRARASTCTTPSSRSRRSEFELSAGSTPERRAHGPGVLAYGHCEGEPTMGGSVLSHA